MEETMKKLALLVGSTLIVFSLTGLFSLAITDSHGGEAKESTVIAKSEEWQEEFPDFYQAWRRTGESSEIIDMLKKNPQMVILWAGYGFAKDYNKARGHMYGVLSNANSLRTGAPTGPNDGPMPTACWTCKSPDVQRVIERDGEKEFFTGKWARLGDQVVNAIGCADCHDSQTHELVVTRSYLQRALDASPRDYGEIDNTEKRTLSCAPCHVEYYFKPTIYTDQKGTEQKALVVTLPWDQGFLAEEAMAYYDGIDFVDWTHGISRAPMIKAQHPDYELYTTGLHYNRGVSCSDCHMPETEDGVADHAVSNPITHIKQSCLGCHKQTEEELKATLETKYNRKEQLNQIAMTTLATAHLEAGKAWESGATEAEMQEVLKLLRSGQWSWDYAIASHGSYIHAPEETLRLLGIAIDQGSQARIKLAGILAKHGVMDYQVPDFSTKEKAQKLAGVDLQKEVEAKLNFRKTLFREWTDSAIKNGYLDPKQRQGLSDKTSYLK
jgi:nitrite reductase (cytochrome c-552)